MERSLREFPAYPAGIEQLMADRDVAMIPLCISGTHQALALISSWTVGTRGVPARGAPQA